MKAVITGGSKGIGRAIALKLAANGFDVALCARNKEDLEKVKELAQSMGRTALIFQADLTQRGAAQAFCESVNSKWGQVDILVNNAGIFHPGNIIEEDPSVFERQFTVNVDASYTCTRFFGKMMTEKRSGHIFNIASIAGMANNTTGGSYAVTKAAMLSLNNVTRQELGQYGVKVTAIVPGQTKTDSWEGTTLPDSSFVRPEDIAEMLFSTLAISKHANVDEIVIRPLNFEH